MIRICPHCGERYMHEEHTGDFVHQCNSQDTAIDQEDVRVIGNYTEDGVTADMTTHSWNKVQSNNPDDKQFTDRGNNSLNFRQRQYKHYMEDNEKNERATI